MKKIHHNAPKSDENRKPANAHRFASFENVGGRSDPTNGLRPELGQKGVNAERGLPAAKAVRNPGSPRGR